MSVDENKSLVRRLVEEVINQGKLAVLDDLLAPYYRYHAPGMEVRGADGMKQLFKMLRTAFPDWYETLDDLIADGDMVVFRVTGHGTHRGEYGGIPPTGKPVTMQGIDMTRLAGGKLVEHWANFDQLGMLQQLGAIPTPTSAAG